MHLQPRTTEAGTGSSPPSPCAQPQRASPLLQLDRPRCSRFGEQADASARVVVSSRARVKPGRPARRPSTGLDGAVPRGQQLLPSGGDSLRAAWATVPHEAWVRGRGKKPVAKVIVPRR